MASARVAIPPAANYSTPLKQVREMHMETQNESRSSPSLRQKNLSQPQLNVRGSTPADTREKVHEAISYEYSEGGDTRKASGVNMHFKDRKFNGNVLQSIDLHIRDYNVCARQHKLSPTQKADFFSNILDGPARTFFFNNARDDMTFDDMASLMISEYAGDARQLQVQQVLETLRIENVMTNKNFSDHSAALDDMCNTIDLLTPQCHRDFRHESNKINWLRKAVIGVPWATIPLGHITSHRYSFNQFVTALREQIQLTKYAATANHNRISASNELAITAAHHQQYGRHPRDVRKHDPRPPARLPSKGGEICHKPTRSGWKAPQVLQMWF